MNPRAIQQAISHGDYFRSAPVKIAAHARHKEWLHFCCSTPEADLLINFSVTSGPDGDTPRLLCAVRNRRWHGGVEHYDRAQLRVTPGEVDIVMGESFSRFDGERYHVRVRMRRQSIAIDLVLQPLAIPCQANNISLGNTARIHWFLVPHLSASGLVALGDDLYLLRDAPAYHDHNWGAFGWGNDYSWVWGYAHGSYAQHQYCLVFDRLTNRARNVDMVRGLLLWRNGRQHRMFENEEIQVSYEGMFRPERVFKLPAVAALLHPEQVTDAPRTLRIEAQALGDWLTIEFQPQELCQIVTPNDSDLEFTIINETIGQLYVTGCVRGEVIKFNTRTMFEFLHA